MKTNRTDLAIALGVIVCSVILLAALAAALAGWRPSKPNRTLAIDFPDATGIREHSQLRYAGALAGRVVELRLLTDEERNNTNWSAVRVTVELFDTVPALPDDVRASLSSDTMLSEKFIALSPGSPLRPKLENGAILLGAGATSLDTVFESIGPLVQSLRPLLDSMDRTLRNLDKVVDKTGGTIDTFHEGIGDVLPRIAKLADGLKVTADAATGAVNRVDKVVTDAEPLIRQDLQKLHSTLEQLEKTMESAGKFVSSTDKQMNARMQELSVVLQNLKVATTHAKALSQSLGEKPNRIIFSGKPAKLPSEAEILKSPKPVPVR